MKEAERNALVWEREGCRFKGFCLGPATNEVRSSAFAFAFLKSRLSRPISNASRHTHPIRTTLPNIFVHPQCPSIPSHAMLCYDTAQ